MGADGISYLDLSDAFRRYDWPGFLNAYWSPLYLMLLGIGRTVLPASKPGELIAAHVVNFFIYVAALGCFEFFYRELRKATVATVPCTGDDSVRLPEWVLWAVAHALFLWASVDLITVWDVSPDLSVSAFTYAIAGLLLRFRDDPSWKHALTLGTVLGASYWAKAVMFPLAFAFMAIALFSTRSLKLAAKGGLVMVLFLRFSPVHWLRRSPGRNTGSRSATPAASTTRCLSVPEAPPETGRASRSSESQLCIPRANCFPTRRFTSLPTRSEAPSLPGTIRRIGKKAEYPS